jgi:hypothetical protein
MITQKSYLERLDMPVSAKKDGREQFAKKLIETIIEANIELKKSTRYTVPTPKKPLSRW